MKRKLTGNFRIRKTIFGWSIKVECLITVCDSFGDVSPERKLWINATIDDLIELGIICS
ncbi:MAG: hypothetical protein ABJH04_07745 [Cyclobacteriaceae bacterium]